MRGCARTQPWQLRTSDGDAWVVHPPHRVHLLREKDLWDIRDWHLEPKSLLKRASKIVSIPCERQPEQQAAV